MCPRGSFLLSFYLLIRLIVCDPFYHEEIICYNFIAKMHILFKRRVCLLTVFFWLSLVSELFSQQTLCPPLTPPLYGTLQDGQCTNLVGSVCNFNCTEGYETIGNTTRVCGENGQWSGREMMCINSNVCF